MVPPTIVLMILLTIAEIKADLGFPNPDIEKIDIDDHEDLERFF